MTLRSRPSLGAARQTRLRSRWAPRDPSRGSVPAQVHTNGWLKTNRSLGRPVPPSVPARSQCAPPSSGPYELAAFYHFTSSVIRYRWPMAPGALSRSENMALIRSRNTAPEQALRRVLLRAGLRPRPHPHLPGSPDLAFVRRHVAVFLDGCFWHGCPQHYVGPHTRREFWSHKLRTNVARDTSADDQLKTKHFRIVRLWQHELAQPQHVIQRVVAALQNIATSPFFSDGLIWWRCVCDSLDVAVTSISGPGSLKPAGVVRPESAVLACRECRREWTTAVPSVLTMPVSAPLESRN